ncbi:epimerase [Ruegeria meonggei]|uniref:RmlD substrate binding domain protein n=1 Tax=Ruegeria meonggei TaxID=1446476 RepID=A0A1X6ZUB5_9RHOB|nr:epimerase [Ruegeria meonggei]SLN61855.1 RmlD substrate binding domain protein [Ruegeria meonggei]
MTKTVLILGATGRFGRNAAEAFRVAGWSVRSFDRQTQDLRQQADGVDVIVNAWNPPYPDWARLVPRLHGEVIAVAADTGATVIIPGNVYVFGAQMPGSWSGATPHMAQNPLGRIRIEMEEAYRKSSVRTIILRAGDFIDTTASGNWFDMVLTKGLARGELVYPGRPDVSHAWAYLPDLARAAVALSEQRGSLPRFCDVPYTGYTLTGSELAQALSRVTGDTVRLKQMRWWPLWLARPFWRMAPFLLEMRYLWNLPHSLDGTFFDQLVAGFEPTEPDVALRHAIPDPTARPSALAQA